MLYLIIGAVFLIIFFVSSGKTRTTRPVNPAPSKIEKKESIILKSSNTPEHSGSNKKMSEIPVAKIPTEIPSVKNSIPEEIGITKVNVSNTVKADISEIVSTPDEKVKFEITPLTETHSERLSLARSILESSSNPASKREDPSIIDVSEYSEKIEQDQSHPDEDRVPVWPHKYIYSANAIDGASNRQMAFYHKFKSNFLNDIYLDLEGNTNYAFVLYFDLIDDFKQHNQIDILERQLISLGKICNETKPYSIAFLKNKRDALSPIPERNFSITEAVPNYSESYRDYDLSGLGSKYKARLKLRSDKVEILNNLIDTSNKFNSIEYCELALVKMFLTVLRKLENGYVKEGKNIKEHIDAIAAIELTEHYKYTPGSYGYESAFKRFGNSVNQTIYKMCENQLRDHFDVGRKTDLNWYIHSENALKEFTSRFQLRLEKLLKNEINKLEPTNLETEIELNEYNKARWKGKLEALEADFSDEKVADYLSEIVKLEVENKFNPSLENIFYQASKFIAKYNKVESLKLYIRYLYYDLQSTSVDNKQLTKTIQKSLFKTKDQLRDFEFIVSDLIHKKDLNAALEAVSGLYTVKRKKIQLDVSAIKEVHEKHSDTVELLNEYLQDEYDDGDNLIKTDELNNEEVSIEIKSKTQDEVQPQTNSLSGLNAIQSQLLDLFFKNSLVLNVQELETFAKSKGVFKNQLVESINEVCFEKLDDVLIEEEETKYTISENYFKTIYSK